MNRNLIRIVAALLVPCLLADPGMASIGPVGAVAVKGDCPQSDFHSIQSIEISGRHGSLLLRVFASQALAPPYGHSSISTGSKVREAQREIVQVRSISEVPPAAPPASSVTDSDVADYLKRVGIRAREQRQASGNSMRDLKGERLRLDWISKFERGKSDALIRIVVHYADGNRVSAVPILDPEAAVPVAWNPETPQPDVNDIYQNVTSLVKEKKRERITGANLAAKGGFSSVLAFYMIIKHLRIGLTVRISALYRLSRALDVTISRLLEKRSPSEEGPRDRQRSRAA